MGLNYVVDTNAFVSFFQGDKNVNELLTAADSLAISIISYIEYLSFPDIGEDDRSLFMNFAKNCQLLNIDASQAEFLKLCIDLRSRYRLKLPDSIIAAQAIDSGYGLVTADKGFQKITELKVINF